MHETQDYNIMDYQEQVQVQVIAIDIHHVIFEAMCKQYLEILISYEHETKSPHDDCKHTIYAHQI